MNPNCKHTHFDGSFLYVYRNSNMPEERYCEYCGYTEKLDRDEFGWYTKITPPEFIEAINIIVESRSFNLPKSYFVS